MQKSLKYFSQISSIPQIIQELPRVKNQIFGRNWGDDDWFAIDFVLFFGDCDGHFGEFIRAHVAVVEKKGFFWSEEIHSFICLVVDYAVAAVLKAY